MMHSARNGSFPGAALCGKLLVGGLLLAASCGGEEKGQVVAPASSASTHFIDGERVVSPPSTAQARASASGSSSPALPKIGDLPPPRPTTLPLTLDRKKSDYDAALGRGDDAFEKGELTAAEGAYEEAKKLDGKRAGGAIGLLRVKIARLNLPVEYGGAKGNRELDRLARAIEKELKREPDSGAGQAEYGRALLLLGDGAGAKAALERAVVLLPNEPEAHSALGIAELATGKVEPSVRALKKAAELDPGNGARRGNLATALLMLGRVKEAIAEYEIAARLADGDARAHADLGAALLSDGQMARAVTEIRRAITIDPTRPAFHTNLGYALQQEGKMEDAIRSYREAIRLDALFASAWINLGTALARDPKTRGEARKALERAKAIDPTDPRALENLKELDDLEKKTPAPKKS